MHEARTTLSQLVEQVENGFADVRQLAQLPAHDSDHSIAC
jgi:hypothetical protein